MTEELLRIVSSMARNPVHNYVVPGLTSSLVGGEGHGNVRLFTNDRDTREWITPHSHRFDFSCLVLEGCVENILFCLNQGNKGKPGNNLYAQGTIAPIDGGLGKYDVVHGEEGWGYEESKKNYFPGQSYSMTASEIHSIRFSKGAKVLFFEGPEIVDNSVFLEPYSNGKTIHTFEVKPWMFDRK